MEDLARAVEMREARLHRELNELVAGLGLVELDLVVGEEPEEGVEFRWEPVARVFWSYEP